MRKLAAAALLAALAAGCSGREEMYEISFMQDGRTIQADGERISLEKAPFSIILRMNRPMGVMLNFQPGDAIYRKAARGEELYEDGFAMAEYLLNPEKYFAITPDTYHYWYYTGPDEHRFDSVTRKDGWYECIREIDNYGVQGKIENHPIGELPHRRLNLVTFNTVKQDGVWKAANVRTFRLSFR